MQFKDWNSRKRREIVNTVLPGVLSGLTAAVATKEVAALVAAAVGYENETAGISTELLKLAPLYPEAQRSTSVHVRYGREMRAWVWSPRVVDAGVTLYHGLPVLPEAMHPLGWTEARQRAEIDVRALVS